MAAISRVEFTTEDPVHASADLIFPFPPETPEQRLLDIDVAGARLAEVLQARDSGQCALRLAVAAGARPTVRLSFADRGSGLAPWMFATRGARHEEPSRELVRLIATVVGPSGTPAERVERVVRHVEDRFTYGRREVGLGDDTDRMPALACDVHLGTCIDTHSYAVAALRAAGIDAAYVSGVFFAEGQSENAPGHCWFVVGATGAPHHWDISHHLKHGLGATTPVFNPLPGRRYALAIGRDLVFDIPGGAVEFSRLCGFCRLDGAQAGTPAPTLARLLDA